MPLTKPASRPMTPKQVRRRIFDILERDLPGDLVADLVHHLLIIVVLLSVAGAVLATVPALELRDQDWFNACETLALLVFTVEYAVLVWVAPEHPLRRRLPPGAPGWATWRARRPSSTCWRWHRRSCPRSRRSMSMCCWCCGCGVS